MGSCNELCNVGALQCAPAHWYCDAWCTWPAVLSECKKRASCLRPLITNMLFIYVVCVKMKGLASHATYMPVKCSQPSWHYLCLYLLSAFNTVVTFQNFSFHIQQFSTFRFCLLNLRSGPSQQPNHLSAAQTKKQSNLRVQALSIFIMNITYFLQILGWWDRKELKVFSFS